MQVEELLVKLTNFSKHFECMICLNDLTEKTGDISDPKIFEQFEKHQQNIVLPNILTSYLASHLLTDNGVLMYQGDQQCFEQATPNMPSFSIAMNQLNQLNLIMGEREDLHVDSVPFTLLDRDQSKDLNDEIIEQNVEKNKRNFEENQKEIDQLVQMIRSWSEGQSRPMAGSYVKFEKIGEKIYPKCV
ncbi:hypothetical protein PPERSA_04991 [Pseudocohnilembus persalinus]|uniref:Uncharacterized protein n=1 Tax=Pseudocohnilembus persalinus TaxID=266149 RepID=A0A0V0QWG4_PSEPJ|nr:hypothetical protein PPERSA_04991 [Pseudocohnilembus persalinus]|eukprot:KRX06378.1 hypothetical protein PPERSA_04991 [Pseudocohnilembus persalinus]